VHYRWDAHGKCVPPHSEGGIAVSTFCCYNRKVAVDPVIDVAAGKHFAIWARKKETQQDNESMTEDPYAGFAARYDWMKAEDPARRAFFEQIFAKHGVTRVLDCACGTGRDLLMFHAMGLEVSGSDLSDAMLARARENLGDVDIPLLKADYRQLPQHYNANFDAVVCLSNSINEPLEDAETLRALRSMAAVLRSGGILVFDQGQTDASMRDPPRFAPVVNNRDFTRFFVIDYAGEIQTVHIFDFLHTEEGSGFYQASVQIRIRLLDSWRQVLRAAGFSRFEFFGDWHGTPYSKETSRRLIAVAVK
jgi:glycine/sarcosine N-methyltransferase